MVSVLMITYKHEKFISDAIEGVMRQETKFPVHLFIGDDASPDNTQNIVIRCETLFPGKITYIRNNKNLGMQKNFINLYYRVNTKYIALCEGDDYWTSPDKLQRQVDFLELNPSYSLCFHNAEMLIEGRSQKNYISDFINSTVTLEDFIGFGRAIIPTASVVMKNNLSKDFLKSLKNKRVGDWYLQLHQIGRGNFYYFNECLSVYRVHEQGAWSVFNERKKLLVFYTFYTDLLKWLNDHKSTKKNFVIVKGFLKNITFDLFRLQQPKFKYFNKYYLLYVRYKYL